MWPRLLALIALASPASAATPVIYATGGVPVFRFEAPDNWTVRTGQDVPKDIMPAGEEPAPRIVSIMPDDVGAATMWVGLWSPPGVATTDEAMAYLKRVSNDLVGNSKVESTDDYVVDGRSIRVINGSGDRVGQPVVWSLAITPLPNGRVALAAFIGVKDWRDAVRAQLTATIRSIAAEGGR